jgi:hypothetical protein
VLLAVVLGVIVFVVPLLLAPRIPLLDPDEGLHASIAQEMVQGGDWLVPRLMGKPFLDKPILYFWAQAASLRVLGMSEAAVRLPGLLLGLLGMISTGAAGARMLGRSTGLLAAVLYASMILPVALAQAPAHDVALVVWVTLAVLLCWESERTTTCRAALTCTLLLGAVLALAMLTKGLAGVALTGIAWGGHLLIGRRLTLRACLVGAAALAVGALIASAWYIAVELRNPGYLHYYFIERHLKGFVTESQRHGHMAWWYYLPILLAGGLPWIAYLPVLAQDQWIKRRGSPRSGPLVLLGCWLLGGTLLLSLSHSKSATYLWPLFPAVAMLAAVAWTRLWEGTLSRPARRLLAGVFWMTSLGGPAVLPATLLVAQERIGSWRLPPALWLAVALVAIACWIPLGFWLAGRLRTALGAGVLVMAAHFLFIMTIVLPHLAEGLSARELAVYFNRQGRLPPRLLLAEQRIGSLVFYLDPPLRAGLQAGQLRPIALPEMFDPGLSGPRVVIAVEDQQVAAAPAESARLDGIPYDRVGRWRLYRTAELAARQSPGGRWK